MKGKRTDANQAAMVRDTPRGSLVKKVCVECRAPFEIAKKLDRRNRRFCSKRCSALATGDMKRKEPDVKCQFCGSMFRMRPAKMAKFCSKICLGAALSKERKGGVIMGRWAGKKDANHSELVSVFRQLGAFVLDLSSIGNGCPDLAIWCGASWEMVEIKNANTAYGRNGLNKMQKDFAEKTGARIHIVRFAEECVSLVAKIRSGQFSRGGIKVLQVRDESGELSAPLLCIPPKSA